MARKVTVELVDDFAADGVTYELDLSALNASSLRGVFERWTPHARKVGRTSG